MKIAISGKGGVGKTTISGTLARVFSSRGKKVIAVDSDPSMNLHTALGVENPIPVSRLKDLIKERAVISDGIFRMNPKVDDILDRYSIGIENVRLIVMGTVDKGGGGCICPENTFLSALLRHLVLKRDEILILDTEAGIEHLGRKTAAHFDLMLVVIEPSAKAVETANRIYELSKEIGIKDVLAIGNKVSSDDQRDFIKNNIKFGILGYIPFDTKVTSADILNNALFNTPNSDALKSIEAIADKITK